MKQKIYAVDFDGTLCKNAWPEIGKPKKHRIRWCIRKARKGHKLILWTCREGEMLELAVDWCREYGLYFHAHNDNLPEQNALYGNNSRKVGADKYIDDKSMKPLW